MSQSKGGVSVKVLLYFLLLNPTLTPPKGKEISISKEIGK